jgi:hypothetical protein
MKCKRQTDIQTETYRQTDNAVIVGDGLVARSESIAVSKSYHLWFFLYVDCERRDYLQQERKEEKGEDRRTDKQAYIISRQKRTDCKSQCSKNGANNKPRFHDFF